MLDRLVADRELTQIMPHHLGFDLNLIELLPRVDSNDAAYHLWHNNHVPEVCLDQVWLLIGLGLLFSFAELFDKTHGLSLQSTVESASGTGVYDITKLLGGEVKKSGL